MTRSIRTLFALALPTGACVQPVDLDDGMAASSDATSSSSESSTSSGAPATTDTSGGAGTTPEQTCAAYCEHEATCEGSYPECPGDCLEMLDYYDGVDADCDAATEQVIACVATLTSCSYDPCAVEGLAEAQCEMLYSCSYGVTGIEGQDGCEWEMICGIIDESRTLHCDDTTCTCRQDGAEIGDCPATPELCSGEFPLGFVTDCCGWLDPFGQPV
ncbi:MAG TPA: hypothetical protein VG755_10090 [Nannocystaceae bacterium]|nr:hypothetical protein [Nannocystaceae bacterium]